MRPADRNEAARGFTLIEVLVALAIAALGLGLMLSATGTGLQSASVADQYIQATSRAQSLLAQVGLSSPLKAGDTSGDYDDGYGWRVHVGSPFSRAALGQAPAAALYPVTVTISWRNGVQRRAMSLHTEKLGPP
jgi:general secretion pathway protein I